MALQDIPRSTWLSFAGGASLAYIFLHLLPELGDYQREYSENTGQNWLNGKFTYAMALLGLVIFFALERLIKEEKNEAEQSKIEQIFWLHIFSYFVYNFIIGYLIIGQLAPELKELTSFCIAMALHFLVNDFGLAQHYGDDYRKQGRWLISCAVVLGGAVAAFAAVHPNFVITLFSLVSGSVILNVLKEELPEERRSKLSAFATGVAAYGVVLILLF
jgi:hypothetical protein